MRLKFFLGGLVAATVIAATPAFACKGSKVLFADEFDEPPSAWSENDNAVYGGGKMVLKYIQGRVVRPDIPALFDDVDICVNVKVAEANDRDSAFGGLSFWRRGSDDIWMFIVGGSGVGAVWRQMKGKWLSPSPVEAKKVELNQGDNNLRLTLKGNVGTAYVNDKQIAAFRGVNVESGTLGLFAQGGTFEFTKFRVTTVPGN